MGHANPAPRYAALGPQGDLFYTSTASGLSGRVFRQDRRTGGVTVVTSEAVDDAVLVDATVLAVVEDDVYVVSSRPEGEFLVHVDVGTGAQTELSALGAPPAGGDRWFVNTIYPDSQSDDLILGNTGGHTAQQGCCGSVTRLATAPGSVPEVITAGFGGGAPQDLKVTSDGQIYFINGNVGIYAVDRAAGTNTVLVEHPAEIGLPSAFVPLIDGTFAVFDGDYADADDNWDGHSVWKVEPGSAEAVEMLADRPSGLTFGWAHLFLVP